MDEDLVLMRRVAAGDRQAFEMLYRRYAQPLAGYLTKLLHQRELVEEVLDDVMPRRLAERRAFRPDSTVLDLVVWHCPS
jgi:RNA polymerase sigma-70 factor (ECF subfamily)